MSGSYHGEYSGDGLVTIICGEPRVYLDVMPEFLEEHEKEQELLKKKAEKIFNDLKPFIASLKKRFSGNLVETNGYIWDGGLFVEEVPLVEKVTEEGVESFRKRHLGQAGAPVALGLGDECAIGVLFKTLPGYQKLVDLQKEALAASRKRK